MKYVIFAILFPFLFGCASFHPAPRVDGELAPFVELFQKVYGVNVNYSVMFSDLSNFSSFDFADETRSLGKLSSIIGLCTRYSDGRRRVLIDRGYFERNVDNPYAIESLVFHELGHCSFNLGHNNDIINGVPASIMYPFNIGGFWYYQQNREYYFEELATRVCLKYGILCDFSLDDVNF